MASATTAGYQPTAQSWGGQQSTPTQATADLPQAWARYSAAVKSLHDSGSLAHEPHQSLASDYLLKTVHQARGQGAGPDRFEHGDANMNEFASAVDSLGDALYNAGTTGQMNGSQIEGAISMGLDHYCQARDSALETAQAYSEYQATNSQAPLRGSPAARGVQRHGYGDPSMADSWFFTKYPHGGEYRDQERSAPASEGPTVSPDIIKAIAEQVVSEILSRQSSGPPRPARGITTQDNPTIVMIVVKPGPGQSTGLPTLRPFDAQSTQGEPIWAKEAGGRARIVGYQRPETSYGGGPTFSFAPNPSMVGTSAAGTEEKRSVANRVRDWMSRRSNAPSVA
jgi:hypothetical protein